MGAQANPPLEHVFRVERKRGPVWYAKYGLPDGRQVQKKLGPACTRRGRPAAGYLTNRLAEDWLCETLAEALRGTLPGTVRSGATFADAAAEWLRYALNPEYPEGGHKARVFASALGFRQEDWPILREQILEGVRRYPVTNVGPWPRWGCDTRCRSRSRDAPARGVGS